MPTKIISRPETENAILSLNGKKIKKASLEAGRMTITFEDGAILTAAAKSGPGADGGWYNWTSVDLSVPGEGLTTIIDE